MDNVPNMGSRVFGLALRRLSAHWQKVHGHSILACETFVDPARFHGTVYQGAGFTWTSPRISDSATAWGLQGR